MMTGRNSKINGLRVFHETIDCSTEIAVGCRLFHMEAVAASKAHILTVRSLVVRPISCQLNNERSCWRESVSAAHTLEVSCQVLRSHLVNTHPSVLTD